ncbi:MAG: Rrf2 family transcriptional regulator [Paludibacter sp.]|nr:Rrf2 family transcriptional regulator [Paludibacter sp.]
MKVNTKIRYGLRTMIEIASVVDENGVLQKEIAKRQNISLKYLDPIISALKLKGLIVNSKGKGSGYRLTRPASEISMYEIYTAFEQISVVECINNKGYCERSLHDCKANCYWTEFGKEFIKILRSKNLEEIVRSTHFECAV